MTKKRGMENNRKKARRPRAKISAPARHLTARNQSTNLFVKLKYATDSTVTTTSSWRFGLAQFWNQLPGYYTQYMTIYKMSRIVSTHVKCTVINQSAATAAELVLVVLPYSDYSKTIDQAKLCPSAVFKYVGGSNGIDQVSLTKRANLNHWLGVDSRSVRDYQQSASEAASTLALLPDTPVIAFYVGGASGVEPTLRVFIGVTYDVEFFLPEYPGSTALNFDMPASTYKMPKDMTGSPGRPLSKPPSKRPIQRDEDMEEGSRTQAPRSRK